MERIVKVSHVFRILFLIALFILPLFTIITWIIAPNSLKIGGASLGFSYSPIPNEIHIDIMTPAIKLLALFTDMLIVAPNMLLLFFLQRLFSHYQQQKIFTADNVKLIRNIGYTLIVWQLLKPIHQALLSMVLTLDNPPGHHILETSFSSNNIAVIVIAFVVILISWVMGVGHKLQEEQDYTV